ncbi:cis-prenyltransferase-like protein [Trypanosoma brucei equiperdum]|uniref:Cis-prenyltransferase-like protein n=1 Tax=Trypanosoma brucei equiperdum TaxID=630700 RepID=A0A3L6L3Q8_9TRYP|nr:cis-prenyltransferase-like protein [Trypanosoma brucei equiperdum]
MQPVLVANSEDALSWILIDSRGHGLAKSHLPIRGNVTAITEGFEVITLLFWTIFFFSCLLCLSVPLFYGTLSGVIHHCNVGFQLLSALTTSNEQHSNQKGGVKKDRFNITTAGNGDNRSGQVHQRSSRAATTPHDHNVKHLAVIMDGNRRYGQRHSVETVCVKELEDVCEFIFNEDMPLFGVEPIFKRLAFLLKRTKLDGHRVGGEKLLEFVKDCIDFNISMLTVYAFSTENWSRPALEVKVLMTLFYCYFERMRQTARKQGIFIRFISPAFEMIPSRIRRIMVDIEEETRRHVPRRIVVNVCVSYSGRDEIINACNGLLQKRNEYSPISTGDLMSQMLRSVTQADHEEEDASVLFDGGGAEPQILLRTSGEQRLSNFLLFECAYTEFLFVDKTWPEINREDLVKLLQDHDKRDKRYGK